MAIALTIIADGDGAWADLDEREGEYPQTQEIQVAGLAEGMDSGRPSVAIRFDFPDGSVAIGQTSLALFLNAADLLKQVHGDPREGMP